MALIDTVNRMFREFRRYTGDGLPGEPTNAPLPIGDPQSGPYNPKKSEIRARFLELLTGIQEVSDGVDDFNQRYLGPFAADPSTDNEGNALQDGALYWNTVTRTLRVWNSSTSEWKATGTRFRGTWDGSTSYLADDLVESGGSIWLAKRPNTNVEPIEGTDWTLFLPGVSVGDGAIGYPKLEQGVLNALGLSVDVRAELIGALPAEPVRLREWRAEWFGVIDHPSTDQTAVVQKIVDAYDVADGSIAVQFPPGQIALNAGASDTPILINKDGVNLKFNRDTVLKKTVANRLLIIVGSEGAVTEGNRIKNFSIEGGTIDGGSIIDTSDDYACVNLKYVDGGTVKGLHIRDASNGLRIGWSSQATWALANRRSQNCRVYDCEMRNMRWFGIEVHGAENTMIRGNRVTGGAISDHNDNIGIRLVRYLRADVDGNIVDGAGRGIGTSTIAGEDNMYASFRGNMVTAPTYGECFSLSGPHRWTNIIGNHFYGAGNDGAPNVATISAGGLGTLSDMIFSENYLTATRDSISALLRLNEVSGSDIRGNKFRSTGVWTTGTKRCLLATTCSGLLTVANNTFDYDYTSGFGVEDSGGQSSLRMVVTGNTFRGLSANTTKTKAIRQAGSSGTLVYATIGDTNAYIDA